MLYVTPTPCVYEYVYISSKLKNGQSFSVDKLVCLFLDKKVPCSISEAYEKDS